MRDSYLALRGGTPVRSRPFPTWPIFDEREEAALLAVLRSGAWGSLTGDRVAAFEQHFATFQEARFGVCVPNGTLALELALRALGIGPDDEVITTPYTFVATASAALYVGARPVFVDIEPDSLTLDPQRIEAAITPRTKAIIPVHIAGRPANLDVILAIAKRHGLRVLEDACQAWGAAWQGRRVGALGDLGAFSFQASKNITAGEGGIVVTNDPELAELCWSLHNVGRVRGGGWYQHEVLGANLRMSEWEGAILGVQLERLPEHMPIREANARYLAAALAAIPGITPLPDDPRVTQHARHLFIFRYQAAAFGGHSRDEFVAALRAEGITPCSLGYVPLYRQPAIQRTLGTTALPECPVTEMAAHEIVWLAQNLLLGAQSDMDDIVRAIAKIQRAWE